VRYKFLQHDYDQLKALVAELQDRKTAALASIGGASEQSSETFHDNPMFDEAHQQSRMWQSELIRMLAILGEAEVVPVTRQTKLVQIGNRVRYRNTRNKREDEVVIGSYMRFGKVGNTIGGVDVASAGSPIGSSLLARKVGDIVIVEMRNERGSVSRTIELEIIEISLL
jgi:transcription elongation GreA/GreB family factor